MRVMGCMGATAVTSEFDMGVGQAPQKVKRYTLSSAFPPHNNDVDPFGRVQVSVGIVDRREACRLR